MSHAPTIHGRRWIAIRKAAQVERALLTTSADAVKQLSRNLFQRRCAIWMAAQTAIQGVTFEIDSTQSETVVQPRTCIEQHTVRSTKQCLVLVCSHLRRRGKEGASRPSRPAIVNRHRLSDFVPVFIADYQGANGGIIQPPA